MSDCAALFVKRNVFRFTLTGLVGIWLAGCSADTSRFAEPFGNPFGNPFASASNDAPAPNATAAPTPSVASSPLASAAPNSANPNYVAAAHPSPTAAAAPTTSAPATTGQIPASASAPVHGSAVGWSAVGGSPVIVADGDNLDGLSRRYGVPEAALLNANGLTSASQVQGGMRIVVPVYNASAKTAAAAPTAKAKKSEREVAEADDDAPKSKTKAKKKLEHEAADASDDAAKPKKKAAKDTTAATAKSAAKEAKVDKSKAPDAAPAAPVAVAKTDPAAKSPPKKVGVDSTPTGNVHGAGTPPAAPPAGEQADASGSAPEFRWPARGRIIQGFKSGGNDGINIAVPEGTSVRAAENGVVAYAGSELKGYGNLVLIRHPNGFVTAYANNGELDVKKGDVVKRGQVVAKSGQSGNVSSPQLHFELRKGSTPVDPTSYLAGL